MHLATCDVCGDGGWVCENHIDRPWEGTCEVGEPCDCGGAGEPCPVCNDRDGPWVKWSEIICSL